LTARVVGKNAGYMRTQYPYGFLAMVEEVGVKCTVHPDRTVECTAIGKQSKVMLRYADSFAVSYPEALKVKGGR